MPKEVIKEWKKRRSSKPYIEVRWGPDHYNKIQVTIDRGEGFVFLVDEEEEIYTGLTIMLDDEEDLDRLIKALQKAKRQTTFS